MQIDILTLFPEICRAPLSESMMKRAQEKGLLELGLHDLREDGVGKHRIVDEPPYGGGPGMVMKPEPIFAAAERVLRPESMVVLLTPQGKRFNQSLAQELSAQEHLILISGHYEGVDHRVVEGLVDLELSIGDYVLTNGAVAAAIVVDAVVRLIPGVLGHEDSPHQESFAPGHLLEAPQYTRPEEFRGLCVPSILRSGNHAAIAQWRERQARWRSKLNRPDLG